MEGSKTFIWKSFTILCAICTLGSLHYHDVF